MHTTPNPGRPPNFGPHRPVLDLLFDLIKHPKELLLLWNWKAATLSIILRGPIFLGVSVRRGWHEALGALCTELIFCAISAGFYGAVVQCLKDGEPQWFTGVLLALLVPLLLQGFEYLLHWFRGTPHLHVAAIVSLIVSGLSALFNWYAMRRGTLLVGAEGGGFGTDLGRLPRLLLGFLSVLPSRLFSKAKQRSFDLIAGLWGGLFPGR